MGGSTELVFGPFRLDASNALLWRNAERLVLPPKAFAVLCYLAERPGKLVSKDELLDSIWQHRYVSDTVLRVCVNELRQVLGDDAKTPRFIETVTKRGYRFMAQSNPAATECVASTPSSLLASLAIRRMGQSGQNCWVGRELSLLRLMACWDRAMQGERQIAFVTGEAGIGKTTLVHMFLNRLETQTAGLLWGRCIENFGAGEAFLPLIEALEKRCRGPEGASLIDKLHDCAPSWLAQMPSVIKNDERDALQIKVLGTTKERMLREYCEFVEVLSREVPLLLVIEDLHWSDNATVSLLSFLARRNESSRIMVVATLRPPEVALLNHPIKAIQQDLSLRGLTMELALDALTSNEVHAYIDLRLPNVAKPESLVQSIYRRTEGLPLFVVNLVDFLVNQNQLGRTESQSTLAPLEVDNPAGDIPHTLRQMIVQQLEHLDVGEQRILNVASVAGSECSAALLAAVLGKELMDIEQSCESLARRGQMLALAGIEEWPNGTVAGRYAFIHALYIDVLYQRLGPAQRIHLHLLLGEALEAGYGHRVGEIAASLALHFAQGRDLGKAINYLRLAAGNSTRRFANQEALDYLWQALKLLDQRQELHKTRIEVLQQCAAVRRSMGDISGAVDVLSNLLDFARAGNHRLAEIHALIELCRVHIWIDRRRTLELAAEAVECSLMLDEPLIKIHAQAINASFSLYFLGWQDHYANTCREALDMARKSSNPAFLNSRLFFHSMLETVNSNYRVACATAEEAVQLSESLGDSYVFMGTRYFQIWSLLHLGEWGQASLLIDEGLHIAEINGATPGYRFFMSLNAFLHCEAMDFKESVAICEQIAPHALQQKDIMSACLFQIVLGRSHSSLNNYPKALNNLNMILQWVNYEGVLIDWFFYFPLYFALGEYWLLQGDCEQSHQYASQLYELAARPPERTYLALAHYLLAKIAMAQHNLDEAYHQASQGLTIVENAEVPLAAWRVHRLFADLEFLSGRIFAAKQHQRNAEQVIQALAGSLHSDHPLRASLLAQLFPNQTMTTAAGNA